MCGKYQDEVDRFDDKMKEVSAREVYRMEKQEQAEQDIFKTAGRSHDYFVGKAANQEVKERAACPIYRDELEIAKRALLLEQKENRQNTHSKVAENELKAHGPQESMLKWVKNFTFAQGQGRGGWPSPP